MRSNVYLVQRAYPPAPRGSGDSLMMPIRLLAARQSSKACVPREVQRAPAMTWTLVFGESCTSLLIWVGEGLVITRAQPRLGTVQPNAIRSSVIGSALTTVTS